MFNKVLTYLLTSDDSIVPRNGVDTVHDRRKLLALMSSVSSYARPDEASVELICVQRLLSKDIWKAFYFLYN